MTFDNPIAGGETLIRSALKSPNYQKGLVGWAVNADGSAEFNNISISSGNLDTAAGGSTGVKIYNSAGNPGSGTVEWDAFTAALKAILTSSQTGSGGTSFTMTLSGTAHDPATELEINVEELAGGGYTNAVRLKNTNTFDLGNAELINNASDTNGWGKTPEGLFYRVRNGWVGIEAWQLLSAGWASGYVFSTLPPGARPGETLWFASNISGDSTRWCLTKVDPSGAVTLMGAASGSNDIRMGFAFPVG